MKQSTFGRTPKPAYIPRKKKRNPKNETMTKILGVETLIETSQFIDHLVHKMTAAQRRQWFGEQNEQDGLLDRLDTLERFLDETA